MNRLSVGIDMDDVLSDFISSFTELCSRKFGIPKSIRPVDWEWSNYGLSQDQLKEIWATIRTIPNFWYELNPEPGASMESFKLLESAKRYYITDRFETGGMPVEMQTAAFIRKHFGESYPTVLVGASKGPVAAALKLDYFIDDRPKNCLEVLASVPTCKVFIQDSTHNHAFHDERISRVSSFDEFAQIVASQA